jgi:hypothetical protein
MRSWDILFDRQEHKVSFTRSKCSNERIHLTPRDDESEEQIISITSSDSNIIANNSE